MCVCSYVFVCVSVFAYLYLCVYVCVFSRVYLCDTALTLHSHLPTATPGDRDRGHVPPPPGAFNGDISKWDVASVTDMSYMFTGTPFNGDISEWDVSIVTTMKGMFIEAKSFNGDISKWDVSRVTDMSSLFQGASLFNADISKWDVSHVVSMDKMFSHATSFNQELCEAHWVQSKASQTNMFTGSPGSISPAVCTTTGAFSSKEELRSAV